MPDVFLFNSSELCKDMLQGWEVTVKWVPRDENGHCDWLAR